MADLQLEKDGFAKIDLLLVEALAKVNLSAYESRVLWCVFRKTYGWDKKWDRISCNQFSEVTGMARQHVWRTVKLLVERHIITCSGEGQKLEYSIQKDYEKWHDLSRKSHHLVPKGALVDLASTVTKGGAGENEPNQRPTRYKPAPNAVQTATKGGTKLQPKGALTTYITNTNNRKTTESTDDIESIFYSFKKDSRYAGVDFENEYKKFCEYWFGGRKKLTNKKLSAHNWLDKALEYAERRSQNAPLSTLNSQKGGKDAANQRYPRPGTRLPDRETGYTEQPYDPGLAAADDLNDGLGEGGTLGSTSPAHER